MLTRQEAEAFAYVLMDYDPAVIPKGISENGGKPCEIVSMPHLRLGGQDRPANGFTMIGIKRLMNIYDAIQNALDNNIPGSFIETGVWRGGASIFAAKLLEGTDRKVYVCDSFEGLPPPDPKFPVDNGQQLHKEESLRVKLEQVQANFARFNLLTDKVVFVKGFFDKTLETVKDTFCCIRLDGDLYSSTWVALEQLYPQLSPGGFCIIDDWILNTAQAATKDYRAKHGIESPVVPIDGIGTYWIKDR